MNSCSFDSDILICFILQNWMAYQNSSPSSWKAQMLSKVSIFDHEIPTAQSSYGLCKVSIYWNLLLIEITQVRRRNRVEREEKMAVSDIRDSGIREAEVLTISVLSHPYKAQVSAQSRTWGEIRRCNMLQRCFDVNYFISSTKNCWILWTILRYGMLWGLEWVPTNTPHPPLLRLVALPRSRRIL